jgi:hypothetical protein
MNSVNYATRFEDLINQQYERELTSSRLEDNKSIKFINAQTIKIPTIELSGYKDHARDGSVNRGSVSNTYTPYTLTHDRDIEFFVDEADVDESNMALSAAHITATFNSEQAIPEMDVYRYSKLYQDFVALGGVVDNELITEENVLLKFDKMMEDMDEAGVPQEGRVLYLTPRIYTIIKNAEAIQRNLDISGGTNDINRNVRSLDDVVIQRVPSYRFMTMYDFTEGFKQAALAKQIRMILVHPKTAIIAPTKVADIYLWNKGETNESAYGNLYQNRSYHDLFIIKQKIKGVAINAEA